MAEHILTDAADVFAFGFLFWLVWVVLNIADGCRAKSLGWNIVFWCVLPFGGLIDVVFNATVGSLLFLQLPHTATLSQRLTSYIKIGPAIPQPRLAAYRTEMAVYLAAHLIEPWAPGHIGLVRYGWPPARDTYKWLKKLLPQDSGIHL